MKKSTSLKVDTEKDDGGDLSDEDDDTVIVSVGPEQAWPGRHSELRSPAGRCCHLCRG